MLSLDKNEITAMHLISCDITLGLELLSFLVVPAKVELWAQWGVGSHSDTSTSVRLKHKPMETFPQYRHLL